MIHSCTVLQQDNPQVRAIRISVSEATTTTGLFAFDALRTIRASALLWLQEASSLTS